MGTKPVQPTGPHGAHQHTEGTVEYSMYVTGETVSLQDQADNGGWAVQNMPVGGEAPALDTRMGTRGSFTKADDINDFPDDLQ